MVPAIRVRITHSNPTVSHAGRRLNKMQNSSEQPAAGQKKPEEQRADERLKLIARVTNDVFWDWDLESNAVWRSESASKTFGYPAEELMSDPQFWVNRIHPEDRQHVHDGIHSAINNGEKLWRDEYRFLCKNGLYVEVLDRGHVIHNAKGNAVRMVGALTDISKQREMETKLADERNLLRALIDNLPDSIYMKDAAARKTLSSKGNFRNLGCKTEAEVLGKTDFDFFTPEVAAKLFEDDQLVLLKGQSIINREERLVHANGEVFWMLTTKVPWRDAAGNIVGIIGGGRNITKQKEVEIKLMAERNLLRTVIDNLPDAIYAKDMGARKTLANPADLKNLGCRTETEALGKNDFKFFPKEVAEKFFEDDQLVLQNGQSVINREEKVIVADGKSVWLLTTKVPWRDADGHIIGLVGIGRDITDKKNLEAQLLRAQRMESIGRMATGIAHDLNNILTPIMISTTLLREKMSDKEGLDILNTVEASAKRGAEIIKQVMWFGRGLDGQRIPIHPQHLIKDTARIVAETLNKSLKIEMKIAADVWPIPGDPTQLHQVLLNLCVNAHDAMPGGGKLTIAARNFTADENFTGNHLESRPGRYVILEITDTGSGIPREIRDRIFEPFFTTKEIGKATGLGLSTALSIVKSHNGFILLETEPGKGSSFQIYLPAQAGSQTDKPEDKPADFPRGRGETILVVDDEKPVRETAQAMLETFGYKVLLANDGAQALAIYSENQADIAVVLTDIVMPVMNGEATVRALRHLNPKVKIIASSGLKSEADQKAIRELGVRHFIGKPFTAGAILQKLHEVITETS
jgi:PAS domain S-box-containing protein